MGRIMRRLLVVAAVALSVVCTGLFVVSVGARPYARAIVALEPGGQDASFDGIGPLVVAAKRRGTTLQVLWTHGMCTHELNWAADRASRIAAALGGQARRTEATVETGGLTRMVYHIATGSGDFDATFLLWSPMTRAFKRALDFDRPGRDRAAGFPYIRAMLNGSLKTELVNDCLSDAVIYSGRNGDAIRDAMKIAICHELGGGAATGQPCDLTAAGPERPLAVVTESLGSKVLFDAARAVYHEVGPNPAARQAMDQRFASVQMIFLMANQIPLLDLASPMAPTPDAPSDVSSLGEMLGMIHSGQMAMSRDKPVEVAPPTVVAFTDPNDLLSYRLLPPVVDLARARLVNVISSNATTWLGFLERPDLAHCGYTLNRTVIGLIAYGHKAGEALPMAPGVDLNRCL